MEHTVIWQALTLLDIEKDLPTSAEIKEARYLLSTVCNRGQGLHRQGGTQLRMTVGNINSMEKEAGRR